MIIAAGPLVLVSCCVRLVAVSALYCAFAGSWVDPYVELIVVFSLLYDGRNCGSIA